MRRDTRPPRRWVVTLLIGVVSASILGVPRAFARQSMQPSFDRGDLIELTPLLALDHDQRAKIEGYLGAYLDRYMLIRDEARNDRERQAQIARESRLVALEQAIFKARAAGTPDAAMRALLMRHDTMLDAMAQAAAEGAGPLERARTDAARADRLRAARVEFEATMAAALGDAQRRVWQRFRRGRQRAHACADARLPLERVDLVATIERLDLEIPIEATDAYGEEMDRAITARDATMPEVRLALLRAGMAGDVAAFRAASSRACAARTAVAEVNAGHLERFVTQVSEREAARLRTAVATVAHPRIHGASRVDRILSAAHAMTLDDDERASAHRARAEYADLRGGLDAQWAAAREADACRELFAAALRAAGGEADSAPSPAALARARRSELDRAFEARLRTVLAEHLPALPRSLRVVPGGLSDQDWAVTRFDRDGDGRLDAGEQATLRRWLAARRP